MGIFIPIGNNQLLEIGSLCCSSRQAREIPSKALRKNYIKWFSRQLFWIFSVRFGLRIHLRAASDSLDNGLNTWAFGFSVQEDIGYAAYHMPFFDQIKAGIVVYLLVILLLVVYCINTRSKFECMTCHPCSCDIWSLLKVSVVLSMLPIDL